MNIHPSIFRTGPLLSVAALALSACSLPNAPATKAAAAASGSFSSGETLQVLHAINNGEIKQAELAKQTSGDDDVQELAEMIIEDHSRSNERINALVETGMELEKSPLSRGITQQAQEIHENLASLSGTEFDCTYVEKQIELHQLALDTARDQLRPDAEDPRIQQLLSTAIPSLENHLQAAQEAYRDMDQCSN